MIAVGVFSKHILSAPILTAGIGCIKDIASTVISRMLFSVAVCAFRDLRIQPHLRKITEKKLRTRSVDAITYIFFRLNTIAWSCDKLNEEITWRVKKCDIMTSNTGLKPLPTCSSVRLLML